MIRAFLFVSCFSYALLIAWGATAQTFKKGNLVIGGRVVVVQPSTAGEIIPIGGEPYISTAVLPEIDVNYFLSDNISVEAIPGIIPHKVKVKNSSQGTQDGGRVFAITPTVLIKYNYEVMDGIIPYAGIGMAYVKYIADDTENQLRYKDDIAPVVQAGVSVAVNEKWVANLDVKKAWADTKVKVDDGTVRADVDINPTVWGVGIGYKW